MRWIAHSPMGVWNPIDQVASELDRWFSAGPDTRGETGAGIPMGINQSEEGLELSAELPGVSPDRLSISVDGDVLELRVAAVEKSVSEEDDVGEKSVSRSRYDHGRVRRIRIPEGIDAEGVQANLKYGVLTLRLPPVAKPEPKKIDVQVHED